MVQTTLKVDGMMCGMCESHVNEVVRKTAQVEKVTSSHTKGETVIVSAPVSYTHLDVYKRQTQSRALTVVLLAVVLLGLLVRAWTMGLMK